MKKVGFLMRGEVSRFVHSFTKKTRNVWQRNDFTRLANGFIVYNSTMNIGNVHSTT